MPDRGKRRRTRGADKLVTLSPNEGHAVGRTTVPALQEHGEFPELPEAEARVVMAQLGRQPGELQRPGSGSGNDGNGGALDEREKVLGPLSRAGSAAGGRERKGKTRATAVATPPAPKKPRIGASVIQVERQAEPALAAESAFAMIEEDDLWDEDPFGHVEAGLALQPRATGRRTEELEAARGAEGLGLALAQTSGEEMQGEDADGLRSRTGGRHDAEQQRLSVPGEREEVRPGDAEDELGVAGGERSAKRRRLRPPAESGASGGGTAEAVAAGGRGQPVPGQRSAAFGRRYTGVVADPVDAASSNGHRLHITGPVIFCDRCGRYATRRVGKALKGVCGGSASGAYAARLARLRAGRHPISGESVI